MDQFFGLDEVVFERFTSVCREASELSKFVEDGLEQVSLPMDSSTEREAGPTCPTSLSRIACTEE